MRNIKIRAEAWGRRGEDTTDLEDPENGTEVGAEKRKKPKMTLRFLGCRVKRILGQKRKEI